MADHHFLFAAAPLFGPESCWRDEGYGVEALFFDSVGPSGVYGLTASPNGVEMRALNAPGDVHFADFAIFKPAKVSAANPIEVLACLLTSHWKYPAHGTQHPKPMVSFRPRLSGSRLGGEVLRFDSSTDYAIDPLAFSLTGNIRGEIPIPHHQMLFTRQTYEEIQEESENDSFEGVPYTWMLNGQCRPLTQILTLLSLNRLGSATLWEPLGDRFSPLDWRQPDWVRQVHPDAAPLVEVPKEMYLYQRQNDF